MNTRYPHLNLDLAFKPISNPNPLHFTPDQISHYNTRGYITDIPLLTPDQAAALFDQFTAHPMHPSGINPHRQFPFAHDALTAPNRVAYLNDLLGPNVICFVSQYINKKAGSPTLVPCHQDAAFEAMDARCTVVWLALQEASIQNGCMWFIPGSHKLGALQITSPTNLNVRPDLVDDAIARLGKVPIELKPGRAVFFSDLLMHISPPNNSPDKDRPALTATYTSASTRPHPVRQLEPILCSGTDTHGFWHPLPKPQ